jgi:hypothetical protein
MPETPNWHIPYPCSGSSIDSEVPGIFCDFSGAIDEAITEVARQADAAANRPNARANRLGSAQTFAVNVAANVQWNQEMYDNNSMINLAGDNTIITIQTPGVYWVTFAIGGIATFTTWTRYQMQITQNTVARVSRKFIIDTGSALFSDNSIHGALVCQAGDLIRGSYLWNGTGGPQVMGRGSLSASFVCDL